MLFLDESCDPSIGNTLLNDIENFLKHADTTLLKSANSSDEVGVKVTLTLKDYSLYLKEETANDILPEAEESEASTIINEEQETERVNVGCFREMTSYEISKYTERIDTNRTSNDSKSEQIAKTHQMNGK